jgi:hypothetical protein
VTATNGGGQAAKPSGGLPIPAPPAKPIPPAGGPTITGTPLPGDMLTCDPGSWTGSPTFTYQWNVNTDPVTGATSRTYTVRILDEGQTITCTVFAQNDGGVAQATSAQGDIVAQKGTLNCPKPSGSFSPKRIGPLSLGEPRASARRGLKKFAVTKYGFDDFCLFGGWGIRGAYKHNRFVLLLTANPFYSLNGLTPGLPIATASHRQRLRVGRAIVIGLNDWYVAPGHGSTYVFKVRHGVIQEIGIANQSLTNTRAKQKRFLASFKAE